MNFAPPHVAPVLVAHLPEPEPRRRLRECFDCGQLHRMGPLPAGVVARCLRCHAVLGRGRRDPFSRPLALALTGLLLLFLAVQLPFMGIDLYGRDNAIHLTTGAAELETYGFWELGAVVFAFTVGAPFARLLCIGAVLSGLRMARPPRFLPLLFRLDERLRPWAMVEVYLLGVFVAYTKLGDLAFVQVGLAVYALGGLMLAIAATDAALDPDAVWDTLEARGLVVAPERLAAALRAAESPEARVNELIACTCCVLVVGAAEATPCPRCGARLHRRKPEAVALTWALLVASLVLYVPANMLPVLTVSRLGQGAPSTILGGVQQLAAAGMWPLAMLVFFASITVPVLKLIGLAIMLISIQRRAAGRLQDRTVLFRIVDAIGRWSMIDIFMVSVLVGLVRLGFVASVTPGAGAVAFCGVVILTMLAARTFDPRLMWDAVARVQAPPRRRVALRRWGRPKPFTARPAS
ncbi:MAG: paraquat-inducible protein A [Acidisphaera sp.]|nr:paraquat-inducible protein A [Acidisphaera sp.]